MAEVNILSDVAGMVWKVLVSEGDKVAEDTPLAIIESMKMEIPVVATEDGTVARILVGEGGRVAEGDTIVTLTT